MRSLWELGIRNLLRNKLRTTITLLAVIMGVCGLILTGGFVRDIFTQLGEALIHSQSGHAQIGLDPIFTYGSRSPEKYLLADAALLRSELLADEDVDDVMARIHFSGLLNNGKADFAVVVEGLEPAREARLGTSLKVVAGRMLDEAPFGAMLGEGLARTLNLTPGDRATLVVSTVDGATNTVDLEITGIFQSFSKDFDARAIRIPLSAAQDLLATGGVSKLVVSLKSTELTQAFVDRTRARLSAGTTILDWQALNDFYGKTVELYRQQFGFLQIMVLLMVTLSVVNTLNMSLLERSWEFGTMRAIGNRPMQVASLVVIESTVLGLCGALVGALIGIALAGIISGVGIAMPPPPNADVGYNAYIRIVPAVVIQACMVGFLATLAAAVYPAWVVSRVSIIDALRSRA